jgi:hypothetical protein
LEENIANWPEVLTLRDCLELAWQARDPDFLAEILLAKILQSYRRRHEVRKEIRLALEGEPDSFDLAIPNLLRNWVANRVAQVAYGAVRSASEGRLLEPDSKRIAELQPGRWKRNPLIECYLERFLELASSRGIPVFLIMPPVSPSKQAENDSLGLALFATRRAAGFVDKYPNLTVFDGRYSGYHASVFLDPTHLNFDGLVPFSHELGALIARRLITPSFFPRWIAAPRFSPRNTNVAIEPLEESSRIVSSRSRSSR